MEMEILEAITSSADTLVSLVIMASFATLFLQGKIVPRSTIVEDRARDDANDLKVEAALREIIAEKDKRIAILETQLIDKDRQAAVGLALVQTFQGAQDQAARTAKALQGVQPDGK